MALSVVYLVNTQHIYAKKLSIKKYEEEKKKKLT